VELKSGCRFYGHWIGNKLCEQAVGRHFDSAKTGSLGIANSNTDVAVRPKMEASAEGGLPSVQYFVRHPRNPDNPWF
jgi:hypothetical protein